jgi:hypothetical protein
MDLAGLIGQVGTDSEGAEHRVVGGYTKGSGSSVSVWLLVQHIEDGQIHEIEPALLAFSASSYAAAHSAANQRLADHFAPLPYARR